MSIHICNRCQKDLKYLSHLQRHQANKKDCSKTIIDNINNNQPNVISSIINKTDKTKYIHEIIDNRIKDANTIEEQNKLINDILFVLNINNTIDTNTVNQEVNLNNNNVNLKNVCCDCKKKFCDRQSLHKHKKLNRCKNEVQIPNNNVITETDNIPGNTSGLTFNDIINSNLSIFSFFSLNKEINLLK